jgi:hypothetical protein
MSKALVLGAAALVFSVARVCACYFEPLYCALASIDLIHKEQPPFLLHRGDDFAFQSSHRGTRFPSRPAEPL